eukprot:scaffold8361_cov118-Isochrysis_galbana.AAC.5
MALARRLALLDAGWRGAVAESRAGGAMGAGADAAGAASAGCMRALSCRSMWTVCGPKKRRPSSAP